MERPGDGTALGVAGGGTRKRASLADVAQIAGVSTSTVSRVVNDVDYSITEETRERVRQAIATVGYTPNLLARAMATGRNKTIGVIIGSTMDPYFSRICRGVEEHARTAGYLTVVCSTDRNPAVEVAYLRLLRSSHAAGIVMAGSAYDTGNLTAVQNEIEQASRQGMRIIATSKRASLSALRLVSIDEVAVAGDLARYLIALGHRRLAFVCPPAGFSTAELRLRGVKLALEEGGLPEPRIFRTGFDFEAGRVAAQQMDPLPDAVIGFSDDAAIGVLMTLREAGVNVPQDVSIAGIDGSDASAFVGLTTVDIPAHQMGSMAAGMIVTPLDRYNDHDTILQHRIVPRATTAGPRAVAGRGAA